MHLPMPHPIADSPETRRSDARRWRRALNLSLLAVLVLLGVFALQGAFDVRPWTVRPQLPAGLVGVATAPLLHGGLEHVVSNAFAVLVLGTLGGALYPKALLRMLPVAWVGSGLAAWTLGEAGSHHLGASGVTHGLLFLVVAMGLARRDRPALAAMFIALLLYGGMLLTVLPREIGVSWPSHLGGALGGLVAAVLWRHADPRPPRRRYSYEDDEDAVSALDAELEPPAPAEVPVLWHRPAPTHGTVVPLRPRER